MTFNNSIDSVYSINSILAFAYLRLSKEEAQSEKRQNGVSPSISNQLLIISNYCKQNNIILVGVFTDDGYTGGNFNRPDFEEMIKQLNQGKANAVITKDLSRLGRDMRESSYYAEEYFPEHGITYIAIGDDFHSEHENIMAPFHFAMNEVYLRSGSKKVKDVLKSKREEGLYCACPPYGYKKASGNKNLLEPDEMTAPVVARIFKQASKGDSTRTIAMNLNEDGVIPPLKYRVLYRDNFGEKGASRASDTWNYTTVKRILKNPVYLGHTVLGKSKKASVKSKKKIPIPKENWTITENTHQPLVSQDMFDLAQKNLGKGSRTYQNYDHIRKSIFSGITFCGKCGHALCSAGTVYNGERDKYWYLSCINNRRDISNPCTGTRIRYTDLIKIVKDDLNSFIVLSDEEISSITNKAIEAVSGEESLKSKQIRKEKAVARIQVITKAITKLYTDNASGLINDEQFNITLSELQRESLNLEKTIKECEDVTVANRVKENYDKFFSIVKKFTTIEELTREVLLSFIDRIEIGEKILPEGVKMISHRNQEYQQKIKIYYKFIDEPISEIDARDVI